MSTQQPTEAQLEELKLKLQEEGTVKCPNDGCPETFKSIWGLRFHLKKNSCNVPNFKCEKCNEEFRSRIEVQQHAATCSSEENVEENILNNEAKSTSRTDEVVEQHEGETKESPKKLASFNTKQNAKQQNIKNNDNDAIVGDSNNETQKNKTCDHPTTTSSREPQVTKKQKTEDTNTELDKHKNTNTKSNDDKLDKSFKLPLASVKQVSNEQQIETPKRKRGRPKKIETPNQQQSDQPVKKKSKFKTPVSEGHTSLRKSSRSSIRKVNYAQIDQSDSDDDDDDDDDGNDTETLHNDSHDTSTDITTTPTSQAPKRRVGRPKKSIVNNAQQGQCANDNDKSVGNQQNESLGSDSHKISTDVPTTSSSQAPKRRAGRPRKSIGGCNSTTTTATPSSTATPSTTANSTTPKKRAGRPKKNRNENEMMAVDKESTMDNVLDENDSKDEGKSKKLSPKKRGRKKVESLTDEEALKRKAKSGQLLLCGNECGKKFTTFLGYKAHMKLCGKEETRQTYSCDICGKVYQSEPGVKYHKKAVHEEKKVIEQEPVVEDVDNDTSATGDVEGTDTPRRVRRAAARAIQKVQDLHNIKNVVEKAVVAKQKKSETLDSHIIKKREHLVTFAIMKKWKEIIKANGKMTCPNEVSQLKCVHCDLVPL